MNNVIIGVGVIGISIYLILRIIHALLHEYKSVFFLNSKNIIVAVILSDIYVIFDVLCVKAISTSNVYVSCIVMVIATTISITSAMLYQQKHLKEYIYTFEITTKFLSIKEELKPIFKFYNIPYEYSIYWFENDKDKDEEKNQGIEVNKDNEVKYHKFLIHAFTKTHSKRLEDILAKYDKSQLKYLKTDTGNYKE